MMKFFISSNFLSRIVYSTDSQCRDFINIANDKLRIDSMELKQSLDN